MPKKLGLALGSGGARGAAHIGFLEVLSKNKIKPDFLAGSSMGALVGACFASGMQVEQMKDEIFKLRAKDILDIDLLPLTKLSLFKSNKLRENIARLIGHKTFDTLDIPFACVAVNMLNASAVTLTGDYDLVQSVTASCSIPAAFKPVEINGMLLTDGGLADRVPVSVVKKMGADIVIGVDVLGKYRSAENVKSLLGIMLKTIDIMDHHATERKKQSEKKICDLWLEVEMGDLSQYNVKHAKEAYEAGVIAGEKYLPEIEKLLSAKK